MMGPRFVWLFGQYLAPKNFILNSWEFSTLVADAREEKEHTVLILFAASLE